MNRKFLLSALLCCIVNVSFAQIVLTGRVVDENGTSVSGATVRLERTAISTVSDTHGNFRLVSPKNGKYSMRTSCIGYESVKMDFSESKRDLIITLKSAPLMLNEVVVTGTGTIHTLKNTPIAIETINSKDIINTGSASIEDALSSLTAAISTKGAANITLNGLGNKHILILLDGKKLAGDVGGDNDLGRIDMNNVKRIEIVKGAASSLYGSDAMGGVINIITNQPQSAVNINSFTKYAKYGQLNQSISVGLKHRNFSSQTSYQRRQTRGWQLSDKEIMRDGKLKDTDKQAKTGFHSNIISQEFGYRPIEKLSLYTKGTYYDNTTDRVQSAYTYDMQYRDYSMALGGQYLLKGADYISFDSYFDRYEGAKLFFKDDKTNKAKEGDKLMSKTQHYFNNVLKGVFSLGKYNKLNSGVEYLYDYLKNPSSLNDSKNAYTLSLYAQDEIKLIDQLQIVAGLRAVYHEKFKGSITPKFSMMYTMGKFRLRGSYSAGFRAPNLMELYYDYNGMGSTVISKGNENLTPEKSNYFAFNTEYLSDYLTISITGYINNIRDIIERKAIPLTAEDEANGIKSRYQYNNASKARSQGVDFSLNTYLTHGFTLSMNYSFVDAHNLTDDTPLFGSSKHTGTVAANWTNSWNKYKLNINFNGRAQSSAWYPPSTNKHINNIARAYQLWNLSTTHTFSGIKGLIIEPSIGVENIFNFRDEQPFGNRYAVTSPGRTFFVSLSLKFKQ